MTDFSKIFNLHEGEDEQEKTIQDVSKNITFKGANLWILACAIIVASVGLNVNSTAVIIGAMLISPLMGPIVGAGFALGLYDFALLKKSLRNLLVATAVSLAVSTIYFMITPFKDVQSELLARTSPNIYDIIIAFFGGIVGVIAVTRAEKGNPIPGVAIATALMPPLCTAGYGLANGQWAYFAGAFYLYCINCVFIGIATFAIVKYLKYPAKKLIDGRRQKQVRVIITLLTLAMLVPAGYLAYSLYVEQQFKKNTEIFIESQFAEKGYTVVYKKTEYKRGKKKIELATLSKRFSKEEIANLNKELELNEYLKGTQLIIRQDSTDRFNALKGDILKQIKSSENEVNTKDVKILQLEKELAKNNFDNKQLLKEARAFFPDITGLAISNSTLATPNDSIMHITGVIFTSKNNLKKDDYTKLRTWLNQRLSVKDVALFRAEDE